MFAEKQASLCRIGAVVGLFVLAGILNRACAACFLLSSLSYVALALAWGFSVSQRVLSRSVRRYLLLGCGMAVLWLLLRAAKYRYFTQDVIARHLWYLDYVPQTLAPLFSLMGALWLGRDEGAPPARAWRLLYLPAALICIEVLTNDLHQLAFRFSADMRDWDGSYAHGPIYFIAMAWSVALLLIAVDIIYRKCRLYEIRSRAWVPPHASNAPFRRSGSSSSPPCPNAPIWNAPAPLA